MPPERITVIWKEIQHFDSKWLERICTDWIMNNNHLPMLPYFYEQASIERERLRAIDKARESREAIEGWHMIHGRIKKERDTWDWSPEEIKEKFGALRKRIMDDWEEEKRRDKETQEATGMTRFNIMPTIDKLEEQVKKQNESEYDF